MFARPWPNKLPAVDAAIARLVSRETMRQIFPSIILAALLFSGQSCLGVMITHKAGLFVQVQGRCYGLYDERYADLVTNDGNIVGGAYWSGIDLGPLGRFGTSSTHAYVRQAGIPILLVICVLALAILVRRLCDRRLTTSLHSTLR
jgi:hypothetical protein